MMNNGLLHLFQAILNLSLVGSYVILLVLPVRLVLCKAPKWCSYLLWGAVFLRLICPVFPQAQFSLIPGPLSSGEAMKWAGMENVINIDTPGMDMTSNMVLNDVENQEADILTESTMQSGWVNDSINEGMAESGKGGQLIHFLSVLWLCGVILLAGWHTFSYWSLKRKVRDAVAVEPGVKEIPGEHLAFVMGVFQPTIYLAQGLDEESYRAVFCHESVHLQRRDYLTKPFALAICCVHWFNPLVWLAFYLMGKDCEMSCDEKVVSLLGEESKKIYSYALLDEATKGESKYYRRKRACSMLSFGEDNVKSRISHVLYYKRASLWVIIGAVIVVVLLIVGLCCNPGKDSVAMDAAKELFLEEGGLVWDADATLWYELDCENDGRKEVFVEIGEEQPDTEQLAGDLWFVSDEGEALLLLEDKCFYRWETFVSRGKEFPLFTYREEDDLKTAVFEVHENKARQAFSGQEEKYVDGEALVCLYPDTKLQYNIMENIFSGYDEKKYFCHYDGMNFMFYDGYDLTKEEVENYKNGTEILKSLEKTYPNAQFEYIAHEYGILHINIADKQQDTIYFYYKTYDVADGKIVLLEEGPGCYEGGIRPAGGTTFVQRVTEDSRALKHGDE